MNGQPPDKTISLTNRLLLSASVVLAAFLGLTGIALDRAFRESAIDGTRERLEARIYMLLGTVDVSADGDLVMPDVLPEPRLMAAGSGAYAAVSANDGTPLWASPSSLGMAVSYPQSNGPGHPAFGELAGAGEAAVLALTYPVIWELENGEERRWEFRVAESRAGLDAEIAGFRRVLWLWLGGVAVLLLAAQLALLTWGLRPLRRVAREVAAIEAGRQSELQGRYPRELRPLTDNLNELLASSRRRLKRSRDALADLAHSLKTPLAVLRSSDGGSEAVTERDRIDEQVERMQQTIDYQLQRAAASGYSTLSGPIDVQAAAERIVRSLHKVYVDRHLAIELEVESGTRFFGDAGDFDEILGNLADNACKWARQRVFIRARNGNGSRRPRLLLEIEDDGPGIPEAQRDEVLKRGVRADTAVTGQGIGLAVVREIVTEVYDGALEITSGALGGTHLRLRL